MNHDVLNQIARARAARHAYLGQATSNLFGRVFSRRPASGTGGR